MRLRNKHTGEIIKWEHGPRYRLGKEYSSIKEFAEDWEDAPEPKKKYYIGNSGVIHIEGTSLNREARETIGNSFDSWVEAYEAREKLRAWKRLMDKGFKFEGWYLPKDGFARIEIEANCVPGAVEDLDILFGEGEDYE